jgi:flagellar motor switch protein FliN/FliY
LLLNLWYSISFSLLKKIIHTDKVECNEVFVHVTLDAAKNNFLCINAEALEVTVELGRTSKSISEILDFAPGTILELDKIAGEPVDVLVNGKFVAKGEVVVIEESFGVRVTEIINQ